MGHQGRAEVHIASAHCTSILVFVLVAAVLICGWMVGYAQLVSDGATNTIDGYSTNLIGDLIVGTNGSFTRLKIMDGGIVTNSGHGYIGQNFTSSSNHVDVSGLSSSWQMGGNLWVGYRNGGPGNQLVINDRASVSSSNAYIAGYSGGNSISVVGGSLLAAFDVAVGSAGNSNSLVISKGGQVTDSTGRIATSSGSHMALVSDPESVWANSSDLYVGQNGASGQLVISNGATAISSNGFVGYSLGFAPNNIVKVIGPGSAWHNRNALYIGYNGKGNQMMISNGGTVSNNVGYLGFYLFSSNNMVIVSGHASMWNCFSNLIVGNHDTNNVLIITDGATVQSSNCSIGSSLAVNNTIIVGGSGSRLAIQSDLWVGDESAGDRLIVTNGAVVEAANLYVGYFFPNYNGESTVLIDRGSIVATNLVDMRQGGILLSSGLLTTAALWVTNSHGQITFSGGTLQSGSTIHNTGSPFVVGGSTVPATFEMLGNGSHVFSSGMLVASNAVLTGNGSITGNVTVASGGSISPGSSIGQVTLNGALVLSNGSTTVMELDAAARTNDNFVGLTSVTYGGTLRITNTAGILTNGTKFKLFTSAVYSGAFDALDAPNPGPGLKWNLNQLPVDGTLRVVSVLSPPTTITSASFSGSSLTISAAGGVSYNPCYLLTSTNLAQPLVNWTRLATNQFDANGNVNFTNATVQAEARRFFRIATD